MGTMKNTNNNNILLASASANLYMELEFASDTHRDGARIVAALTDFLARFNGILSAEDAAQIAADIERIERRPASYVFAGWARTTIAHIWRSYR